MQVGDLHKDLPDDKCIFQRTQGGTLSTDLLPYLTTTQLPSCKDKPDVYANQGMHQ